MTVDQRTEDTFLGYVLELARREAAARVRQDDGATARKNAPDGARRKG